MPHIDYKTETDELLAIRCQLGEPAAFDDLISRWQGPLWAFVRRLAGNDEAAAGAGAQRHGCATGRLKAA